MPCSNQIEIVQVGVAGPQGPPGTGGASTMLVTAGDTVQQYRVVTSIGGEIFHASSDALTDVGTVVGVNLTFANAATTTTVQTSGKLDFVGWSWVDGPIYLSTSGLMTQTAPTSGFICEIGKSLGAQSMLIEIQQRIVIG